MIKHFVMAVPLLLSLTGCIIVVPLSQPSTGPSLPSVTPCQNTPMPDLISCTALFSNPIDYIEKSLKTLQKANTFVDVILDVAVKIRKIFDIFR